MKQSVPIWLVLLLAAVAAPCFAKKVHAPLSPKILAAKTYIENLASYGPSVEKPTPYVRLS